jgi:hypothetical protein
VDANLIHLAAQQRLLIQQMLFVMEDMDLDYAVVQVQAHHQVADVYKI